MIKTNALAMRNHNLKTSLSREIPIELGNISMQFANKV